MEENKPLVSFVVNCYNGEKYLKKCFASLLNQTYQNWELIFWDNASIDKSAEIFNTHKDSRFKYFKSKINVTLGQARAWAVDQCNGEYIGFLDVDDEWLPSKTEIQISQMMSENTHLSYTSIYLKINEKISSTSIPKYNSGYLFDKQLERFEINMPSSMIKTEALKALNINFDPRIVASEEFDLFMQIAAKYKISVIKQPLCIYRVSNGSLTNLSVEHRAQDKKYTFEKLENNYAEQVLKYKKSYLKAKAKISYYEFQYFYSIENYSIAKKKLKKVFFIDFRYSLIFISLYIYPKLYKNILKLYDGRGI